GDPDAARPGDSHPARSAGARTDGPAPAGGGVVDAAGAPRCAAHQGVACGTGAPGWPPGRDREPLRHPESDDRAVRTAGRRAKGEGRRACLMTLFLFACAAPTPPPEI